MGVNGALGPPEVGEAAASRAGDAQEAGGTGMLRNPANPPFRAKPGRVSHSSEGETEQPLSRIKCLQAQKRLLREYNNFHTLCP